MNTSELQRELDSVLFHPSHLSIEEAILAIFKIMKNCIDFSAGNIYLCELYPYKEISQEFHQYDLGYELNKDDVQEVHSSYNKLSKYDFSIPWSIKNSGIPLTSDFIFSHMEDNCNLPPYCARTQKNKDTNVLISEDINPISFLNKLKTENFIHQERELDKIMYYDFFKKSNIYNEHCKKFQFNHIMIISKPIKVLTLPNKNIFIFLQIFNYSINSFLKRKIYICFKLCLSTYTILFTKI